jgi:hypothetical protein
LETKEQLSFEAMRKVSKKRAALNYQYDKLRYEFMQRKSDDGLYACCDRCIATFPISFLCIHHKAGRSGNNLLDVNTWMLVCAGCHEYIHANPAESFEKGWMLKRSI